MKKLAIVFLLLAGPCCAVAATLKIATIAPEGSQWMKDMRAGAAEIKKRTDGRVQIKYYGGGVQGNDTKVLGKIRIGALHGGAFTPSALGSRYPNVNLYGLPLIFESYEQADYVRERLDDSLIEGLEDAGFVTFGFAAGGFAYILSNTPVRSIDDLKGKRVWVPEGDKISYASMEAMELSPVTLPLTDVLTGLQTGLIDIVAISPIGALVLQWHTKVKFMTELPLVYTMGFMALDKKAFDRLGAEDQAAVRDVMTRTYENFDRQNLVDNDGARDALLRQKIESVPFDEAEIARIRDVLHESNRVLGAKGEFSLDVYDRILALTEEYRQQVAAAGDSASEGAAAEPTSNSVNRP